MEYTNTGTQWEILKWVPLESLSSISANPTVMEVVKDAMFWKARVEALVGNELPPVDINWRSFSYLLEKKGVNSLLRSSNPVEVQLALDIGADPSFDDSTSLIYAANTGNTAVLQVLLDDPRTDPNTKNGAVMRHAIQNGRADVVDVLLADGRIRTTPDWYVAIDKILKDYKSRLTENHSKIIRALIANRKINPAHKDSVVLMWAAYNGYTSTVYYILKHPHINPANNRSEVLRIAVDANRVNTVRTLLKDGRVNRHEPSILALAREKGNPQIIGMLTGEIAI